MDLANEDVDWDFKFTCDDVPADLQMEEMNIQEYHGECTHLV